METIKECRVCSNQNLVRFFDMGEQPPANSLVRNKDIVVESYPLSLSWCPNCNLVQLNETVEPTKLFSNYVWVTGTSPSTIDYSKEFYKWVTHNLNSKDGYILEIASNDGTFLKPFFDNGYFVLGVDPAENIAKIANDRGIQTICKFFNKALAEEIIDLSGKASVVIARNVIPHVADLHGMMQGIVTCLDDNGLLVIECHNASIINDKLHYDSIYHEHLHYFTLKSIEYLLSMYGLYVNDIKQSPISGGSMVLFINKYKDEQTCVEEQREDDKHFNTLDSWQVFSHRAYEHRELVLKTLEDHGRVHCYGASARGLTLLNFCKLGYDDVVCIYDRNPIKQNMFTPVSYIPIVSVDRFMADDPSCILVTAWNFADEIMDDLRTNYGYNGIFVIPLPSVRVERGGFLLICSECNRGATKLVDSLCDECRNKLGRIMK